MNWGVEDCLSALSRSLTKQGGGYALEGVVFSAQDASNVLRRYLHHRFFCGRTSATPPTRSRASGDSGFVGLLADSTRGASCWEKGFRIAKRGGEWVFASDGRVCLFLEERGQWDPFAGREGEPVAVRVPRCRENLVPFRFTLHGGLGGLKKGEAFRKYLLSVSVEGALSAVEMLSSRAADRLSFAMAVVNEPRDFERLDTIVVDVADRDDKAMQKLLTDFARSQPHRLKAGVPVFCRPVDMGLSRAEGDLSWEDRVEGFGERRCVWLSEAVAESLQTGEMNSRVWLNRLEQRLKAAG